TLVLLAPSLVLYSHGDSRLRARNPYRLRNIEEHSHIRLQRTRCPVIEVAQAIEILATSESLVRERGVGEAIAEYDLAALERGADDFRHVLSSRGSEEKHLRHGIDHRRALEKNRADPICGRRSAGLLRDK